MKRKIKDLSPKEVLALAIQVEISNGQRLRNFARVFDGYDDEVARKFDELAAEEDQHREILEKKYRETFSGPVPEIGESDVEEVVESVDLDDAEHQIFNSLKARRVFQLALQAEHNARRLYETAAQTVKDKNLTSLFREMAGFEDDHVGWLEQRIALPVEGKGGKP